MDSRLIVCLELAAEVGSFRKLEKRIAHLYAVAAHPSIGATEILSNLIAVVVHNILIPRLTYKEISQCLHHLSVSKIPASVKPSESGLPVRNFGKNSIVITKRGIDGCQAQAAIQLAKIFLLAFQLSI